MLEETELLMVQNYEMILTLMQAMDVLLTVELWKLDIYVQTQAFHEWSYEEML